MAKLIRSGQSAEKRPESYYITPLLPKLNSFLGKSNLNAKLAISMGLRGRCENWERGRTKLSIGNGRRKCRKVVVMGP